MRQVLEVLKGPAVFLEHLEHLELQHHLVIDQRVPAIGRVSDVLEARSRIEVAGTRCAVVSIEADRVGWPGSSNPDDLVDTLAANAASLIVRTHRHAREIERTLARSEIALVDCPGLPRAEREGRDGSASASRQPDLRNAQVVSRAAFGRLARPMSASEPRRQIPRCRRPQRDNRGDICFTGLAEAQARTASDAAASMRIIAARARSSSLAISLGPDRARISRSPAYGISRGRHGTRYPSVARSS